MLEFFLSIFLATEQINSDRYYEAIAYGYLYSEDEFEYYSQELNDAMTRIALRDGKINQFDVSNRRYSMVTHVPRMYRDNNLPCINEIKNLPSKEICRKNFNLAEEYYNHIQKIKNAGIIPPWNIDAFDKIEEEAFTFKRIWEIVYSCHDEKSGLISTRYYLRELRDFIGNDFGILNSLPPFPFWRF